MDENGVICAYPWVHFAYTMTGKIRPCCRFTAVENEVNEALQDKNVITNYEDAFGWLRLRMLYGIETKECNQCYIEDKMLGKEGKLSMRGTANKIFELENIDPDPKFHKLKSVEISLDNICNLQCKMCSSQYSSQLYKRDNLLYKLDPKLNAKGKKVPKNRIDELLNLDIDWSHLMWIKILGGEPFMSPNFPKLISKIINAGNAENTTLEIVSNATNKIPKKLIKQLIKFKEIKLTASIDGTFKYNDYQRVGSNFEETISTYEEYLKQLPNILYPHVHSTYTILNLNNFANDMEYWVKNHPRYSVSFNLVRTAIASNLSPYHCPPWYYEWLDTKLILKDSGKTKWYKEMINMKIATVKELIKEKGIGLHQERWEGFITQTKVLDEFYDLKLEDHNPELYELLRHHREM